MSSSETLSILSLGSMTSSPNTQEEDRPVTPRREYVWRNMDRGQQSLPTVVRRITLDLDMNQQSSHRCSGYIREEIMLATTTASKRRSGASAMTLDVQVVEPAIVLAIQIYQLSGWFEDFFFLMDWIQLKQLCTVEKSQGRSWPEVMSYQPDIPGVPISDIRHYLLLTQCPAQHQPISLCKGNLKLGTEVQKN
ncbi:hypothetical protein B0H14DRAFT_2633776 [Mycena olivaceomarginata]|nr:hypothetical protein B0H14DRAFT_2633776 [Mycena olivaceomarginata]